MSLIWKIGLYNKLKVSEEAECLECKRIGKTKFKFSCKGGTTSTLLHHLRQHPGYEKQFYEIKFEDQQASAAKLMLLDQTESKSSLRNPMTTDCLLNKELKETLIEAALAAQKNSYSPYSKFPVGAAIVTKDGNVFSGANVENASYGVTICAERSAIVTAISTNGPEDFEIQALAVVGNLEEPLAPCGTCRQMLSEFGTGESMVILYSTRSKAEFVTTFEELLPFAFTKKEFDKRTKFSYC